MEDAIDYALRYGGRCRDCADTKIDGVCDTTGTPCNPRVFRSAIEHALRAWRYGIEHGFIVSPFAPALDSGAAKEARIAELTKVREALLRMEHACEQLAATRTHKIYTTMIDGGQTRELLELDNARRAARAALQGGQGNG